MKKLIYISGPISADNIHDIYANLRRFFRWEALLLQKGYSPINPAADFFALMMMGETKNAEEWYERLLGKDEPLVKRSDALLMLKGWRNSKGALREYDWAKDALVPVFFAVADLERGVPPDEK